MRWILPALVLLVSVGDLPAAMEVRTVLVFPFKNQSARPDLDWISESFAETLASCLTLSHHLVVDRQERNTAYEHLAIPSGTPLTLASSYKVAEALGVDWAVLGSFNVEGNRLSARVQLLDTRRLKLTPAGLEATGELTDLADLQVRLAWRLLATHDPSFTVGTEEDFRRHLPPIRLDAFEKYVRGLLASDPESRGRFLRAADRLNPTDHRAALELGRHYFRQKDYEDSARWLRKLTPADPHYREALFLLGVDEFFLGNEPAAEKAFAELARQMPLNEVWNNLGLIRARLGRYQEALADFEKAYRGDPTDADFCFNLGACLWHLKRYQEAAQYLAEALRLSSEDPEAHTLLAQILEKLGDTAGRAREFQWLAEHEENADSVARDLLPNLRLKKGYNGRAFRMLAIAVRHAREERLAGEPAAERKR